MPGCKSSNFSETGIRQFLELDGWTVHTKGWPDFLCTRECDGQIQVITVEAKSPHDKIREHQEIILDALSTVMPVYMIRDIGEGMPLRIVDWRKRRA